MHSLKYYFINGEGRRNNEAVFEWVEIIDKEMRDMIA